MSHAMFKASLFMAAGAVLHTVQFKIYERYGWVEKEYEKDIHIHPPSRTVVRECSH